MLVAMGIDILDALDVVLAIPQQLVGPGARPLEARAGVGRDRLVAHDARQLLERAQPGQVVDRGQRVGPVELDVVRVVLTAVGTPSPSVSQWSAA